MKVDRLVSIIMILLEKKKVSAEELANTFEVSKRTIYRDIDSIRAVLLYKSFTLKGFFSFFISL